MKITDDLDLYESSEYVDRYHEDGGNRIDQILTHIQFDSTDSVVDYACGNGLLLPEIHDKVSSYIGIDFSTKFIERANAIKASKNIDNGEFVCADIIEFASENQSKFDKAFSLDFTEHLNDENLKTIFTSIASSVKADGEIIIHTPNGDYFLEVLKNKGIMKQVSGHIGIRNSKRYIELLNEIGISDIKVIYLNHYLTILKPLKFLSWIPLIGKFFRARLLIVCKIG